MLLTETLVKTVSVPEMIFVMRYSCICTLIRGNDMTWPNSFYIGWFSYVYLIDSCDELCIEGAWWGEMPLITAGFTYRLDRLKHRTSRFRGLPVKVYNILNTVIELSHLCCHNVLYFLNKYSLVFLTVALHFRILQNVKHPSSSLPLLKCIKDTSMFPPVVKMGNWEGLHKWISLGPLFV
jgi:hypothetical protein